MGKGKTCLKPSEVANARAIANAIQELAPYKEIASQPTIAELTFCWQNPEFDLPCKCRPDLITADFLTVVDFKSAADATHRSFQAAAYRYHYYVSAAFTLQGVHASTGIMPRRYLYFVGQSSSPHLAAAYEATADEIKLGLAFVRRNLRMLRDCMDRGTWPGLPDAIQPLGLPPWVKATDDPEQMEWDTVSHSEPEHWWE
ncbi:MAG TPA: PD-(D/E)XK nuclease-like domain-containing protein [Oligoflexus sp.]|uniref:PD-(D/E)XK nuclease-like domain-containing protein n=1 Tax=Oligoflexus sp. TaxID=1971216 RepID=UPI002D5CB211|nr:PD-(D/E)XK nuclease-like domain-containing protein [Oligoflexus sp.]HYX32610.1 PD-(D/E)XK nuclease-like domain-containing protein [Oligoflexus sp.]